MGSADEVQVVPVEELADNVGPEREGDPAVVLSPALHVLVGVGPQQVAQQACQGRTAVTSQLRQHDHPPAARGDDTPVSGTSVGLMIRRICSMDCRSGDRPAGRRRA